MPRRIIDVGGKTDDTQTVYLLDLEPSHVPGEATAAGIPESRASPNLRARPEPYAALSYCWGPGEQFHKTTKANVQLRRNGIAVGSLPKSIRDAISVCQGLGIRYIWIDALCIVQDDEFDWQRESVRMLDVYANSYITIAVHAAASCHEGFLGKQGFSQPPWQPSFQVDIGESRYIELYVCTTNLKNNSGSLWPLSPLMDRGWTLQEAILPRRIIHYTGNGLLWECAEHATCECNYMQREGRSSDSQQFLVKRRFYGSDGLDLREFGVERPNQLASEGWMKLVNMYSRRKLSVWSDRLVASRSWRSLSSVQPWPLGPTKLSHLTFSLSA